MLTAPPGFYILDMKLSLSRHRRSKDALARRAMGVLTLVAPLLVVACQYDGSREEAATLAKAEVKSFCGRHPRACVSLTGPLETPSGNGSYAFEWTNSEGRQVLLVVVDRKGWPELTTGPGFDPSKMR